MAKELTLQDMYIEHLKDMYSAENQIIKALPKIINTVTSPDLKEALTKHLKETEKHVSRIDQIFEGMGGSPRGKKCVGMEGLLEEGKEAMAQEVSSPDLMDANLTGGCQKVEHYEICSYKDVIHMADLLGDENALNLLNLSLQEEEEADRLLAEISPDSITPETVHAVELAE